MENQPVLSEENWGPPIVPFKSETPLGKNTARRTILSRQTQIGHCRQLGSENGPHFSVHHDRTHYADICVWFGDVKTLCRKQFTHCSIFLDRT